MLSLKIKFADDIRRVSVEPSISYSTVQDLVQKLYTSALPSPFCFKYVDEEGDLITISSENDWREAASSGRPLTLTVHTGGSTISTPTPTPTPAPTPATTTNVDGFEMLFTSQQLLAAANANAPTPVAEPDPAAILSFDPEVTPSSGSDNNTDNNDEASCNVNIDDLPLQERLEALLVEAIFSGEKFLDEVLASLKRQTANTELPTIHELLEGFFQPLREAYRTSGTKACEFFAALQEHAQSSMLLARIASMISLASDSIAKSAATSSCEISNKLGGLSIDQHIRSFVTKIETHPDVQVLVTVLKQKLAAMRPQQQHFSAEFVADVTIADGSELTQNQRVVKTWRVRNNGNTAWPVDVKLFDQDNVVRAEITSAPAAGEEVELSIDFTPTQIDAHTEYFTLRVAEGAELRLWIHFIGVPAPEFPAEYAPLLAQLEAMGFVRDSALAALTATEGNLNEATDLLLNSTQ